MSSRPLLYGKAQAQPAHLQQGLLCVIAVFHSHPPSRQGLSKKWQRQVWLGRPPLGGGRLAEAHVLRLRAPWANGQPTGISPRFGGVPGMAESGSPLAFIHGQRGQQAAGYTGSAVCEQFPRGAKLHDMTAVHHRDVVADLRGHAQGCASQAPWPCQSCPAAPQQSAGSGPDGQASSAVVGSSASSSS